MTVGFAGDGRAEGKESTIENGREEWQSMKIVHVKEKSANVMESVMNAGNIMQSQTIGDLFTVRKRDETASALLTKRVSLC